MPDKAKLKVFDSDLHHLHYITELCVCTEWVQTGWVVALPVLRCTGGAELWGR